MPDGRFRYYYWQIRTLLSEREHLLDTHHSAYEICEDYEVEYTGTFGATIVFKDGSRLVVRFTLRSDDGLEEYDYAYVYLDAQGNRVFQYDDAPHHPHLPSHPHHWHKGQRPARSPDQAFPLDMPAVSFVTVLDKVIHEYLGPPKVTGE
jgi:hypothetical protein